MVIDQVRIRSVDPLVHVIPGGRNGSLIGTRLFLPHRFPKDRETGFLVPEIHLR